MIIIMVVMSLAGTKQPRKVSTYIGTIHDAYIDVHPDFHQLFSIFAGNKQKSSYFEIHEDELSGKNKNRGNYRFSQFVPKKIKRRGTGRTSNRSSTVTELGSVSAGQLL